MPLPHASPRVIEIVLTGGSCAGKTQSLETLAGQLRHDGHRVITVPEVATMLIKGGVQDIGDIAREDGEAYCRFQREVFLTHRAMRRRARSMAEGFDTPVAVILYDRGELDGMAYHSHDCFDRLAAEDDTTIPGIRDSYSAIMHLVTTADGAEDFYSGANNSARWDNAEEARFFDTKVLRAWSGGPHQFVIDNSTDYVGKFERLLHATISLLDAPGQMQINLGAAPVAARSVELEFDLDAHTIAGVAAAVGAGA